MHTNEQILSFLKALSANNHREWFQAHKAEYDQLRQAFTDEVQQLIHRISLFDSEITGLEGESLKRMPAGYPTDTPHGDILRHKDFCVVTQQSEAFFSQPDWLEQTAAIFELLQPFNRFLNYTVDDYLGSL